MRRPAAHARRGGGEARLRALAALVLDALQDGLWSSQALAVAGGADGAGRARSAGGVRGPARPLCLDMTSDSAALAVTAADRGRGAEHDTHGGQVDESHAEIWQLVTRAQQGDGDAFGQLYDRYIDGVYRYIYFRVNDRGLAEDFASETFLRALRRIGGITYQGRDIGAWFITIARNIVLDHMKSARHRLEVTTGDVLEGNDTAPGPEASVLSALTSDQLIAAVKRLNDEQRECIVLRFVHGLSVSETAEAMGKNDGAIKALQHRAVRKLAELIGGDLR